MLQRAEQMSLSGSAAASGIFLKATRDQPQQELSVLVLFMQLCLDLWPEQGHQSDDIPPR